MQNTSVDLWATDEVHFQQHGSRCRMWISRNQGPRPPACPHPQERGLFRGRASTGWAVCVPSGNRKIQRARLSSVSPATPLRQPRDSKTGCSHHRQCQLSPLPPAPSVAGKARPPLCFGLPSPVQSRTQSDRARVERPSAIRLGPCGDSRPRLSAGRSLCLT